MTCEKSFYRDFSFLNDQKAQLIKDVAVNFGVSDNDFKQDQLI